ncbi:MAG: WD40 repeat domain-containing protein [Candidatus Sulfotelmatobacter sp.]
MKTITLILSAILSSTIVFAQDPPPSSAKPFPPPDFTLHDATRQEEKPHTVLGPMTTDKQGKVAGSFAVYGGSSLIQVSSLSFSSDGKLLAVGSTPSIVDIWDVEKRTKIRSFDYGATVALSPDGRSFATNGRDVRVWDVESGKLLKSMKWSGETIWRLAFDSTGTRLLVRANGKEDTVFDVTTGQLLAVLKNTQEAQFSRDGGLLIGGNGKHLVVWSTKDWSQIRDLPNGPDYVTRFAVRPENDMVVIGGPKSARLVRLSSGEDIAKVGDGYTNFAAFDQTGSFVLTYTSSGFAIWDTTGRRLCGASDVGSGTMALSSNGRWLASAGKMTDVTIWDAQILLHACGATASAGEQ